MQREKIKKKVAKPKKKNRGSTPNKYLLSASTSTDAPTYLTLSPETMIKEVGAVFIQSLVHVLKWSSLNFRFTNRYAMKLMPVALH
jgi:hypothetical protein